MVAIRRACSQRPARAASFIASGRLPCIISSWIRTTACSASCSGMLFPVHSGAPGRTCLSCRRMYCRTASKLLSFSSPPVLMAICSRFIRAPRSASTWTSCALQSCRYLRSSSLEWVGARGAGKAARECRYSSLGHTEARSQTSIGPGLSGSIAACSGVRMFSDLGLRVNIINSFPPKPKETKAHAGLSWAMVGPWPVGPV
mmetsp:Transcript_4892/g.8929  ORF Transcript_4892/g.8929 Transcript_4892/m.8929 type:complete len:201 (+) Transcript_4892:639-1241(+)